MYKFKIEEVSFLPHADEQGAYLVSFHYGGFFLSDMTFKVNSLGGELTYGEHFQPVTEEIKAELHEQVIVAYSASKFGRKE